MEARSMSEIGSGGWGRLWAGISSTLACLMTEAGLVASILVVLAVTLQLISVPVRWRRSNSTSDMCYTTGVREMTACKMGSQPRVGFQGFVMDNKGAGLQRWKRGTVGFPWLWFCYPTSGIVSTGCNFEYIHTNIHVHCPVISTVLSA